jgi:hypothetical protein
MRKFFVFTAALSVALTFAAGAQSQHGTTSDHLLGSGEFGNIELVSTLDLTDTADVVADVAVSPDGDWAFLADWGTAKCNTKSEAGGQNNPDAGAYVVDISDLENPEQVGFIASSQDTRPGEGMQVVNITTKQFSGDVLVMNNEQCGKNGKGGLSLFDVTDPRKPNKLSEHFGDRGGIVQGDTNDIHSAFAWDTGENAYAVIVDNFESADVDILDITNPRRPRLIAELDLSVFAPGIRQDSAIPNLNEVFLHDMTVKLIGGDWIMLLSYWDGGFVQLDVTDPANPTLIGDTDYTDPDPELLESTGIAAPPEGNGHQAEFTSDNQYFIGGDEDFTAHGVDEFKIDDATSPYDGTVYPAGAFSWTKPIAALSDGVLNGPTMYGGYGCPGDDVGDIPDPSVLDPLGFGEEAILVLQRGPLNDPANTEPACFFSEKVQAAQDAGYDAVIIANHHAGAGGGVFPDATLCGSKGHEFVVTITGICLGHRGLHNLFGATDTYTYPEAPAIGTIGADVTITGTFDGWGYVHLFSNTPVGGKFPELDTYAIDEAHDPVFAFGFGDLTVHEVATDPQSASNAYLSYYNGGLRSIEIQGGTELVEVGGYLDPIGNDFWGVETFVRDGFTYIAASDRDDGLWIFKRTP